MTDLAGAVAGMPPDNGIRTGKVISLDPLVVDVAGGRVDDAGRLVDAGVGDTVALMRQGQTWLVLGRVKAASEASLPAVPKTPLTLVNGWIPLAGASFEAPSYHRDALGYVHLSGQLTAGTVGAEVQFSSLPPGFQSLKQHIWPVVGGAGTTLIRIDIRTDGTLRATNATAGQFVSIDGISFLAEK